MFKAMVYPSVSTIIPVVDNAEPKFKSMQLVVFSHGLLGDKNTYSCLYRELASCGFAVASITHSDGSASYHPKKGALPKGLVMHDYKTCNKDVCHREKEVESVIKQLTETDGAARILGSKWKAV